MTLTRRDFIGGLAAFYAAPQAFAKDDPAILRALQIFEAGTSVPTIKTEEEDEVPESVRKVAMNRSRHGLTLPSAAHSFVAQAKC